MLWQRMVLGPVLILLAVVGVWLDDAIERGALPEGLASLLGRETMPPGVIVFPLVVLVGVLAARELARILRDKQIGCSTTLTCGFAVLGVSIPSLIPSDLDALTGATVVNAATGVVLVVALAFYARHRQVGGMVAAAGGALLAFVYLGLLLGFLPVIRREHSAWVLLWVLLVTKSCDIGAYFTGRSIGRHKLIPWLSPGKTWEGLFGGIVFAAVVGSLGAMALPWVTPGPVPSALAGAAAGVLFAVVGQAGDLVASLLKRDAGIKDAGRSLPGFGGMLDVLDSLILVAPVAFWWLRLTAAG